MGSVLFRPHTYNIMGGLLDSGVVCTLNGKAITSGRMLLEVTL
jgi:hypothetical protein